MTQISAHRRTIVIHSLVLVCLFLGTALRTTAQYHFESWSTEKGLPQNTVHSILQTADGYLWLATSDGLVRFDGMRFTVFNVGNTQGINSNRFERLFEDSAGNLWLTTGDNWVTEYRNGGFTSYSTGGDTRDDIATGIWQDAKGRLVISTRKGFATFQDERFVPLTIAGTTPCRAGFESSAGLAWCHDDAGLRLLNSDGSTSYLTLSQGLPSNNISYAYRDRAGNLWIATRDAGLSKLKDGVFTSFAPHTNFTVVTETRDGTLWFGTEGGGLIRLEHDHFTTYTTTDGLSDNNIRSLYEDREGTLWVGTVNHGLTQFNKQLITTLAERQGLSPVNTYSILQDHLGAIWVATWNDGISRYENGKFTHYKIDSNYGPLKWVTALAEDRVGRLWVAAIQSSVGWFKDGKYTSLADIPGEPHSVSVLLADDDGALWIGTDVGLKKYQDGNFTTYTAEDGLAGNDVKALHKDRLGHLWIGTYGGLTRFADGKFESYRKGDGLASNRVRSIYEDQAGTLWIGTYDGGLSRLKNGKLVSYTVKDGLFDGGVFQILEDDRGNFWMSCNHGIYRVTRKELEDFAAGRVRSIHSVAYGTRDGMLNVECNGGTQPAGIKTRDGRLWFPTQDGVALINPGDLTQNSLPPPVVIESGVVDQKPVDLHGALRVEPGQDSLEIHYTGLSFIKPEQIVFRYRLEGLDKDWVEAGNRRVAYYSHLPPGNYTFVVTAANADGLWNSLGDRIQITVVPPFWRRWWFVTLGALGVMGAALFIYRQRVLHLHRARAAQEAFSRQLIESQENERKRIAAELHDSIGQSLLVIKNRAQFAQLKSPGNDLNEEFDEIKSSASQAITEVREIAYNLRPYHLDRVGLTRTIEAIVDRIGAASGISFRTSITNIDGLLSNEGEINLYRVVQETLNNIVKHADAAEASIEVSREGKKIRIKIADDGRGFVTGTKTDPPARGFGLIGITERVRMLGGHVSIQSSPGRGTMILVSVEATQVRE